MGQNKKSDLFYSFCLGDETMPISSPINAPITNIDIRSTIRMVAADGILKKLPMLIARRIIINAIFQFRIFICY